MRQPALFVALLMFAAPAAAQTRLPSYHVEEAHEWTALFDQHQAWSGADGIYSIPLNGFDQPASSGGGRTAFVFSDTFVGGVDPDGTRQPGTALVNNTAAFLRGRAPDNSRIKFVVRRDAQQNAQAMIEPETPSAGVDHWYWFLDGIALGDALHLLVLRMKPGAGGVFNFAVDGIVMATTDLDALGAPPVQVETPFFLPENAQRGQIMLGGGIMANTAAAGAPQPDEYVYVYGTQNDPLNKRLVAARVPPADFANFGQWEYYDGQAWSSDPEDLASLTGRISSEFSVTPMGGGKYLLIFQQDTLGTRVAAKVGSSPVGPWSNLIPLYDCPEVTFDPDIFVYNAKAHPHLSEPGELLISYNVNTFDFWDHFADADIYRPRFIRLVLD